MFYIGVLLIVAFGKKISEFRLDGQGLGQFLIEQVEDNTLDCQTIEVVVQRGFGQILLDLIQSGSIIHQEYVRCVQNAVNSDLDNLKRLARYFLQEKQDQITMTPILFWAQSKEHILLKIKFSHRIDAPAYINVKNHIVNNLGNSLIITADSEVHQKLTQFRLELNYYKPIETLQESIWKLESVGTMVLNLTKAEKGLWKQLSNDKNEKFQIWWDIKDQVLKFFNQIGKDMDEFSQMLEKLEEDKVKRKKSKGALGQGVQNNEVNLQTLWGRMRKWIENWF